MTFVLSQTNYGKSEIRLVKVVRTPGRHELSDVTVDVMLEGDFAAAHNDSDNSALLATDTMRNTVYVLAAKHDVAHLEPFGRALVEHFVVAGPTVRRAQVRLVEHPWARLGEHEHAFQRGNGGHRVAIVTGDDHSARIEAGIEGLELLRTTGSTHEDSDGLINVPLTVREIQAVAFLKEVEPGTFRISLRSKGDVDVNRVANRFGGGGHKNAAGCTLNGPYADVRRQLVDELNRALA